MKQSLKTLSLEDLRSPIATTQPQGRQPQQPHPQGIRQELTKPPNWSKMSAGAKENWIRRRKKALTTGVGEERGEGEVRPV